MIEVEEVLAIHSKLIKAFGGSHGVRDRTLLESAVYRPFMTFDGKDLYETPIDKASAILESIVKNHPFIDGNKRTGYVIMRLLLLANGLDIVATQKEKYDLVINIISGDLDFEGIKGWIGEYLKK